MGTVLAFLLVYIIYFIFSISKYDKNGHYKDKKHIVDMKKSKKKIIEEKKLLDYQKLPNEVKFFINMYKVDLDKINLRGLLKLIGVILGLCIALSVITAVYAFHNHGSMVEIIVGFVMTIVLYMISLNRLGKYFKKKGLCKNE